MLSTGDVVKIVISFLMPESVVAQLVVHYLAGLGDDVDENDTLDAVEAILGTAWAEIEDRLVDTMLSDTIKLSVWDAVEKQFDEVASKATSLFDGQGLAGEMLPHGAAVVCRFFTNIGRRQGRKFIPGLMEGSQDGGNLTALAVTDFVGFNVLWNDQVVVDSTPFNQGVFNVVLENFRGFQQSTAVNTIIGYQRRRKAGVGI